MFPRNTSPVIVLPPLSSLWLLALFKTFKTELNDLAINHLVKENSEDTPGNERDSSKVWAAEEHRSVQVFNARNMFSHEKRSGDRGWGGGNWRVEVSGAV